MRVQHFTLILIALCVLPLVNAASQTFTAYDGDSVEYDGETFTVDLTVTRSSDIDQTVQVYNDANGSSTQQNAIRTALAEIIDDSKLDDRLYIRTAAGSKAIGFGNCSSIGIYDVCFEDVTYPEEDGPPLGAATYTSVKVVDGVFFLPVEFSINGGNSALEAERTFSTKAPWRGDIVEVNLTITNDGDTSSRRYSITDYPSVTPDQGTTTLSGASLAPDETKKVSYKVDTSGGNITFHAQTSGVTLADQTLAVKDPISVVATSTSGYVGDELPVTVLVHNQMKEDLVVRSIRIQAQDVFSGFPTQLHDVNGNRELTTRSLTLKNNTNTTIKAILQPTSAGVKNVSIFIRYANGLDATLIVPYSVTARQLSIDALFSGNMGTVTIDNTLDQAIVPRIEWGDGTEETRTVLPGSLASYSHTYAGGEGTLVLTYEHNGVQTKSFPYGFDGASSGGGPLPLANASTNATTRAGEVPAQPEPSNETKGPIMPQTSASEDGFVDRFVGWIINLFI